MIKPDLPPPDTSVSDKKFLRIKFKKGLAI